MFSYKKRLQYPINIKKKDLKMAKYLFTQYGGSNGELAAALRYLNQRVSMPDNRGKALLTDIGTEELSHVEMLQTMVHQLTKDATTDELIEAGLGGSFAEHGKGIYPVDANGVPFSVKYFATTGDPLADLSEDMAAEQKARAVYENLIDMTDDEDIIKPLLWLRQREIVHFARFKELFEYYQKNLKNGNNTIPKNMIDNNTDNMMNNNMNNSMNDNMINNNNQNNENEMIEAIPKYLYDQYFMNSNLL